VIDMPYGKLVWYSLSTNKKVKKVKLPTSDGVFTVASLIKPVIYTSETVEEDYNISVVDCTLSTDEPMQHLFCGDLNIEMDNCGDGVDGLRLVETENGRLLQIYLLGTGDRAFQAIDLDTNKLVVSEQFEEYFEWKTIRCNPGTSFYAFRDDSGRAANSECNIIVTFINKIFQS